MNNLKPVTDPALLAILNAPEDGGQAQAPAAPPGLKPVTDPALLAILNGEGAGPERSLGEEALRKAEFASRGFSDAVLGAVGGIPDLVSLGMRAVGLPAPREGFYADNLKAGWQALGEAVSAPLNAVAPGVMNGPATTGDQIAYGAGKGVGDAATVLAPAGTVSQAARAGTATRGVAEALSAQPVLQAASGAVGGAVGEATDNPLLGTLAAIATPLAATVPGRVISPVRSQLSAEEQRLVAAATREGIPLTVAQQTGSKPLKTMEAVFETLPLTSGPQMAIQDAQRSALNRAILARAGVAADRASPEVLDDAFQQIGQRFNDLAKATTVQVDDKLFKDVDALVGEYGRRLPTDVARVFDSYVDDLNQMRGVVGAEIPGESFQNIISGIKARARASTGNPPLQMALNKLADAVDQNMVRSAPPEIAQQWKEARRQYRNLLMVDKSMSGGTQADRIAGNIPYAALRQAVKQSDQRGYSRGRGEMNDLARVADLLGASRMPSSGTSERVMMSSLLTGAPLGAGIASVVNGANPVISLLGALAGAGLPRGVQALYNSPAGKAWLTNQVAAQGGPAADAGTLLSILGAREKDRLTGP